MHMKRIQSYTSFSAAASINHDGLELTDCGLFIDPKLWFPASHD